LSRYDLKAMPKGNPNPSPETRFVTDKAESLTEKLTLRLTPSMMQALNDLGDRKNDFVREALATALKLMK
jgi:hypothetical protein